MKKFITLCVFTGIVICAKSQAVLNEVYPQPGNGYHEFFELYNQNSTPENLDNYTLVLYYEETSGSGKKGFYILDLPNHTVPAHGYYVGASQNPFDIQQQGGLTADFSWNSMPAGGSLTNWELNGSSYVQMPVPGNLNDLFGRLVGGSNGVYHAFVYKNGILVNGIIGGINISTVPAYIKAMPDLPVDMSGASPDFTIDFDGIPDNGLEYIPNSLGTNNGYYRSSDGLCGEWLKSDQPGQHNPGLTNGADLSLTLSNDVRIAAVVSQYPMDPTKALLSYNITSAPASAFPLTVEVYTDLGVAGQWDLNDVMINTRTITSAFAGNQYIILPSWDVAVIIVVKSPLDCYNRVLPVGNYYSVLPVELLSFQGNINKENKVTLQWKVDNNETIGQFEIQRSTDGKEFTTIALAFTSEKTGIEDYRFYETISNTEQVIYRLKLIGKAGEVSYSKTIVFQTKSMRGDLKIIGNPVKDKLTFNYTSTVGRPIDIKIVDLQGRTLLTNKINSLEGNNLISISLVSSLNAGMYFLETNSGGETRTAKFVKQ